MISPSSTSRLRKGIVKALVRLYVWTWLSEPLLHGYAISTKISCFAKYSKTCLKRPLKNRQNEDINDKWLLNEGRKYCRMLPLELSAILLTCTKRCPVLKNNFGLLIEWPLKTGFTVKYIFLFHFYFITFH